MPTPNNYFRKRDEKLFFSKRDAFLFCHNKLGLKHVLRIFFWSQSRKSIYQCDTKCTATQRHSNRRKKKEMTKRSITLALAHILVWRGSSCVIASKLLLQNKLTHTHTHYIHTHTHTHIVSRSTELIKKANKPVQFCNAPAPSSLVLTMRDSKLHPHIIWIDCRLRCFPASIYGILGSAVPQILTSRVAGRTTRTFVASFSSFVSDVMNREQEDASTTPHTVMSLCRSREVSFFGVVGSFLTSRGCISAQSLENFPFGVSNTAQMDAFRSRKFLHLL